MDRKDIEDFLRRSNSICDQTTTDAPVNVRRVSLKEFTGLDASSREQLAKLSKPTWKTSASPSSLISSFSARRRSVLSTDIPDSPTRRLTTQKEESIDLPTAIDRISSLKRRLLELEKPEPCSSTGEIVREKEREQGRQRLLDDSKRIANAAKEFSVLSPEQMGSLSNKTAVIAEVTDSADCLTTSAANFIEYSDVYHSQLVTTEVTQVLSMLFSMLSDARCVADGTSDFSILVKSSTQLTSSINQLIHALSSL